MPSPISPAPTTSTGRPASAAEALGGQRDRGLRHRGDAPGDAGLGADPLADLEGVAEEQVERGAGGALVAGDAPRPSPTWPRISLSPSTAESSPAATSKRWRDGLVVVVDVEVVGEVLGREEGQLGEEVADVVRSRRGTARPTA